MFECDDFAFSFSLFSHNLGTFSPSPPRSRPDPVALTLQMERLQQEMQTKALVLADLQKNVRGGERNTQLKRSHANSSISA